MRDVEGEEDELLLSMFWERVSQVLGLWCLSLAPPDLACPCLTPHREPTLSRGGRARAARPRETALPAEPQGHMILALAKPRSIVSRDALCVYVLQAPGEEAPLSDRLLVCSLPLDFGEISGNLEPKERRKGPYEQQQTRTPGWDEQTLDPRPSLNTLASKGGGRSAQKRSMKWRTQRRWTSE